MRRSAVSRMVVPLRERLAGQGPFLALCFLLVLAFLLGGGARMDIQSLMFLRPIAILLLGYGAWSLKWEQVKAHGFLFGMAAAIVGLVLVQLIPLPPAIWSQFPGRQLVVEIDRAAQLGAVWRPVSLVPVNTWNAFYALMVPLAVLVLGVQLDAKQRGQLLPVVIGLGLLSGLIGALQLSAGSESGLYFYQVTNKGSAVGLFANRNHQAVFLGMLFPMLAVWASFNLRSRGQAQVRAVVALAAAAFLLPLILVTGSRAGLAVAGLGLLSVLLLYRPAEWPLPKVSGRARWIAIGLGVGIVVTLLGLVALTFGMGRAEAISRIFAPASGEDLRFRAWPTVWAMVQLYFPIGTGFGSFVEVFQVHEPRELLSPIYFNHAHNDWLEVLLTGGAPTCLLLLVATVGLSRKAIRLRGCLVRSDRMLAYLGVCLVAIFAVASVTDYLLRVPSLACLFIVAVIWISSCQTVATNRNIHL